MVSRSAGELRLNRSEVMTDSSAAHRSSISFLTFHESPSRNAATAPSTASRSTVGLRSSSCSALCRCFWLRYSRASRSMSSSSLIDGLYGFLPFLPGFFHPGSMRLRRQAGRYILVAPLQCAVVFVSNSTRPSSCTTNLRPQRRLCTV
jgi:hypothetical protein